MTTRTPLPRRPEEWRPIFLEALRNSGNVRAAAKAAGISRQAAYQHKDRSPTFAKAWDAAMEDAIDMLEAIAVDRARKQSDPLLMFLLKAHRPGKYRETTRHEHAQDGGGPVVLKVVYEDAVREPMGRPNAVTGDRQAACPQCAGSLRRRPSGA